MGRLIAAALVVCASSGAGAQPAGIVLDAVDGCPDRRGFFLLVEQHAGQAPPADMAARVAVERDGDHFTALVELPGSPSRRLDGATCAEVLDAAALVVALAIDVPDPNPDSDSDPDSDPDPDPDPDSDPDSVRLSRPATLSPPPFGVRLRAGGLGAAGMLPRAAIAATVSGSIWRGLHGLDLSFALFRPTSASVPGEAGKIAPVGLWTVGLRACREVSPASVCLGGEVGRMTADTRHLADGREAVALWTAATASGFIRRRIAGNVRVYAGVDVLATVLRPRFILDDDTTLHRSAPIAARALVGFELEVR